MDPADRSANLSSTRASVLADHSLPRDLGRNVAKRAFQNHARTKTDPQTALAATSAASLPWLLVAALFGVLFGSVVMPMNQGGNITEQLLLAEMTRSRQGFLAGGANLFANNLLPASVSTVRVLFLIPLVLFVTRASFWTAVYPARVPASLVAARWLAVITALIGFGPLLIGLYVAFALFAQTAGGGQPQRGADPIIGIGMLLNQMWWLAFWITAFVLLFVAVNAWTQRYVQTPDTADDRR